MAEQITVFEKLKQLNSKHASLNSEAITQLNAHLKRYGFPEAALKVSWYAHYANCILLGINKLKQILVLHHDDAMIFSVRMSSRSARRDGVSDSIKSSVWIMNTFSKLDNVSIVSFNKAVVHANIDRQDNEIVLLLKTAVSAEEFIEQFKSMELVINLS